MGQIDIEWTVRTKDQTSFCVPADVRSMSTYILLEQERWFEDELPFLLRMVQPGMGIIDIGANHGVYAINLAARVGDSGFVLAFEPAPDVASRLAKSFEDNGLSAFAKVLPIALSNRAGEARLCVAPNSELNQIDDSNENRSDKKYINVRMTTLDALMLSGDIPCNASVDVLKIDAEGHEFKILEGGSKFLASYDPLIMFEWKSGEKVNVELFNFFFPQTVIKYIVWCPACKRLCL